MSTFIRNSLYSSFIVLSALALFFTFSIAQAENDGKKKENDERGNSFSVIKKEDREEWKIPGGEPRVEITPNGTVLVRGAKIVSVSGNEILAKVSFGAPELAWTIKTNNTTQLNRRYGGQTSLSEFSAGDIISFSGVLISNASALTAEARVIKNWSIQKTEVNFVGEISSINASSTQFVLNAKNQGMVTVLVGASTTIKKGNENISFASLSVGDKTQAKGLFNNTSKILVADKVHLLKKEEVKPPKTFEGGVLKSLSASSTPATMIVNFNNTDYSVSVDSSTLLLNNSWAKITLSSMQVGDKIRVYGAESIASSTSLFATVVRDTSIPR